MKSPYGRWTDRGFGASRGPAEKIMVPDRSAGNAVAAFSAAMAGASSMRGWSPEPAHKLDDERFLRTVVVTGFWSLARARRKNNWSQTGRPKCDGCIFGRDGRI